jgi:uncharacterized membrane protein
MSGEHWTLIAPITTAVGAARQGRRWPTWLFPAVAIAVALLFVLAPGTFEHKAHAALHGLCAQRPSHSLRLGGRTLPFDARMSGIYGGFLVTTGYLALRRRYRAFRLPPPATMAMLGLFVAAMALDGTNSLLLDLGLPHAYPPDNRLRLATGLLTGIALAVILCFLLATTLWREGRWQQRSLRGPGELALVVALQLPVAAAVLSGLGGLYVPIATLLLLAATAVVGGLMLVVVVLIRRADRSFETPAQVQGSATLALLLALVVMALLSGGRFWLEATVGVVPLT